MANWRHIETLFGETVREMGILVSVFAPLEAIFTDIPVSRILVAAILVFGLLLIAGGIILEART